MMNKKLNLLILICITILMITTFNLTTTKHHNNITEVQASEVLTAKRGDKVVLQAQLIDDMAIPVENETIFFFDETHDVLLGKNVTDINGVAQFIWHVPLNFSIGPLLLNITYLGSTKNFLLSSAKHITIDIVAELHLLPFVTDSTGNKKDRVVAPTDWVFLNITVVDDVNDNMKNIDVIVTDKNNFMLAHNITNDLGFTILRFQIPATWAGLKTIFIKTNCTNDYIIDTTFEVELNITKIEKIINITEVNKIVYYGDTQNISGKLIDEYGMLLKNVQIYLTDSAGNIISSGLTNKSGDFLLTVRVTQDVFSTGEVLVFLTTDETSKYMPSKVALQFIVRARSQIVTNIKNNSILIANNAYNISILLFDQFNTSIANANITLRFEESNYTVFTDDLGRANIYLFILPNRLGMNNLTFIYKGGKDFSFCISVVFIMIYDKPNIKVNNPTESTFTIGEIIRIDGEVKSQYLSVDKLYVNVFLVNYTGFSRLVGKAKVWSNGSFSFYYSTTNVQLSSKKENFMLKLVIPKNDTIYSEETSFVKKVVLTRLIKTKCNFVGVFNETDGLFKIVVRLIMYNNTGVPFENITVNVNNISSITTETNKTGYAEITGISIGLNTTKIVIDVKYAGSDIFLPSSNIFFVEKLHVLRKNKNIENQDKVSISDLAGWGLIITPALIATFYFVSRQKESSIVKINKMLGG